MRSRVTLLAALACALTFVITAAPAWGAFGIEPGSLHVAAVNRDGTPDLQAGSHPYAFTVSFSLNHDSSGNPEGNARDVIVDLPRGLIGNPTAVPRCSRADFDRVQSPACPGSTQVGTLHAAVEGITPIGPVYNLVPPQGVAARLGFSAAGFNALLDGSVLTGEGYGVAVTDNLLPRAATLSISSTIWGDPADSDHDPERSCVDRSNHEIENIEDCSSGATPRPFLTLPTSCTGPLATTLKVDSIESPGEFVEQTTYSTDTGGDPTGLSGCSRLPFKPTISVQPESSATDTPTGLRVDLHIPQPESVEGLAEAHLKDAVVKLPAGMVVNPASANGLQGCSSGQIGLDSPAPAACPDASKIGSVEVDTPLVEHSLPGAVYLAAQGDNPFDSLLAIYVVVDDPQTGVIVKLAGHVQPDPATGQLTTTFSENPQLPFEDFKLDFFGGPRAPLVTPGGCGTFTTTTDLTPWSSPEGADATPSSSFSIDSGCGAPGFAPSFSAGTLGAQAGAYSPLSVTFSRQDHEQSLGGVSVTTPPGLLGSLANAVQCPEPQASKGECGPESLIGETSASVGAGPNPYWVTGGKVYLTGPYNGGPFGLSIVVPTTAGPFTLTGNGGPGREIVRSSIRIDPYTAQVTVVSDPLPTILEGIPLQIRTVNVTVNRPSFTFNPTDCAPLAFSGAISSTAGTSAGVSAPFSAVNCANLPFQPKLTASAAGHASKANGTSFAVQVTSPGLGQASIAKVALTLPKALPSRLTTIQKACADATFDANPASCPEGSLIGSATVHTPLLNSPLTGPAYFVSHGNAAFPDVEFVLQGEGVTLILDGKTDIKKGITYSRFEAVPDAPFTSFETVLPAGPHSIFTAHVPEKERYSLCRTPLAMPTEITGQNGAVIKQSTKVAVTGCPKAKGKPLTRAQKLAAAMKRCKKKGAQKRIACERQARRKFGPVAKPTKRKK
ncbi:MAG TPA: hypothetical protein VMB05_01135 [Solirubrobacteraceae bacterium]|nr:hypothetical protein [Solirubrobacteraceae bacterium]